MNWKAWIPLAVAIVLGLVAAQVARKMLASRNGGNSGKGVRVVIAKTSITPGQELTADVLTLGAIAAEAAPANSFKDPAEVVGRVAQAPLFTGQPVLAELLAAQGAGSGLQALIPRGFRAITINVAEDTGLAGLITPGCRVDVVSTIRETKDGNPIARTLVRNAKVTAVGQQLVAAPEAKSDRPSPSVTLLVSPRDAELIELAVAMGKPRLILRSNQDQTSGDNDGVTLAELLSQRSTASYGIGAFVPNLINTNSPPDAQTTGDFSPRVTERRVTVIRGTAQSEVSFQAPAKEEPGLMTTIDQAPAIPANTQSR